MISQKITPDSISKRHVMTLRHLNTATTDRFSCSY